VGQYASVARIRGWQLSNINSWHDSCIPESDFICYVLANTYRITGMVLIGIDYEYLNGKMARTSMERCMSYMSGRRERLLRRSALMKLCPRPEPAPRKERVLPASDPAIAASRAAEAAVTSGSGGAEWHWQAETRFSLWAAESTRLRALGMAAAGDGGTPVRRNRFHKRQVFGDGKRTVNACTPKTQHGIWNIT
jgi:hypothetical protein